MEVRDKSFGKFFIRHEPDNWVVYSEVLVPEINAKTGEKNKSGGTVREVPEGYFVSYTGAKEWIGNNKFAETDGVYSQAEADALEKRIHDDVMSVQ